MTLNSECRDRFRTSVRLWGRVVLSAALVFCVMQHACVGAAEEKPVRPLVIAYVFPQETALQAATVDGAKLSRINYAFANIKAGRMVAGSPDEDGKNFAVLNALKQRNPDLRVLVSVGGWAWSGQFSDVALTQQSRAVFIQSVIDFINRYHLDGLDVDWEYPGMTGAGHRFRAEDGQNFTLLLKELRERFDRERGSRHALLLTIAAGASDEYLSHTDIAKVSQIVDTINLMAYDFYEPSSDKTTGHHAPLYTNPADPKGDSADRSVRAFLKAGAAADKLVLGVPFYGHVWGGVADRNHGLFQAGKPSPQTYARYDNISTSMLGHGFVRYWDTVSSVPYLYNAATRTFVSYEDEESLRAKCRYVLDHRLAGMMFWEYSADSSGRLLQAIDVSLIKKSR